MERMLVLAVLTLCLVRNAVGTNTFDCEVSDFYAGVNVGGREVGEVLKAILHDAIDDHEPISFGEVVGAMIDLDGIPGSDPAEELVLGIYSQIPKTPFPETWNREHSWPSARGVGDDGLAHDDLFGLFPADASLNSARSAKFYDECIPGVDGCESPAQTGSGEQAAEGSSEDRNTWQPPTVVQGDLARAIFYMATRYDGSDEGTNALKLEACNSVATCGENTFGNLTTLLKWHVEDPVSPEELARVNGICERYQGTRNPYVDFPELALRVFDENFEFQEDNAAFILPVAVGGSAILVALIAIVLVQKRSKQRLEKGVLEQANLKAII